MQSQLLLNISNPKRNSTKVGSIYNYYAGYTSAFVKDILEKISRESVVLDPWNGSGTTTAMANSMGLKSFGFDINPVMIVIAKSRLIDSSDEEVLSQLSRVISHKSMRYRVSHFNAADPLDVWFTKNASIAIRCLERAIQYYESNSVRYTPLCSRSDLNELSSETCFMYVALFNTVKKMLKPFKGTNPTWIKKPMTDAEKVDLDKSTLLSEFLHNVHSMISSLDQHSIVAKQAKSDTTVRVSSSLSMPLKGESIDLVLSSPPYCTRIDYVVSTSVELSIMGFTDAAFFKKLRNTMIGTPTISGASISLNAAWGETCNETISSIETHSSKASASYYVKTFIQYFDGIYNSLCEIDRVLKADGQCILVVQDSFYKDLHIDLATIISDMSHSLRWELREHSTFESKAVMTHLNTSTKRYRKVDHLTESVLLFSKT